MAKITRVEALMVDLVPKVKRTDAIQSFVRQETPVSLCAAVPNARWVEYIPQLDSLTEKPMRIENGHAIPSDEPGLGIAWDFAAIKRATVASLPTKSISCSPNATASPGILCYQTQLEMPKGSGRS